MPLEEGTVRVAGQGGPDRYAGWQAQKVWVVQLKKMVMINKIRLGWGKGDLNVIGIWQRICITRFRV